MMTGGGGSCRVTAPFVANWKTESAGKRGECTDSEKGVRAAPTRPRRAWVGGMRFAIAVACLALLSVVFEPDGSPVASASNEHETSSFRYDVSSDLAHAGGPGRTVLIGPVVRSEGYFTPAGGISGHVYDSSVDVVAPSGALDDVANHGGEFLDDSLRSPIVRPDIARATPKIQRDMARRGWTPQMVDDSLTTGQSFPAVNKLGGANTPATRYVDPATGQSIVVDNATGEIVHVGGPGFLYD